MTVAADPCRYRLLDTIRSYALERLAEGGEADQASERHAAWFAALAGKLQPDTYVSASAEDHVAFASDLPNLRSALSRFVAAGDGRSASSLVRGARLPISTPRTRHPTGAPSRGRRWG